MTFDDYTISIQWQIKKTAVNFFCFKSEQKKQKNFDFILSFVFKNSSGFTFRNSFTV